LQQQTLRHTQTPSQTHKATQGKNRSIHHPIEADNIDYFDNPAMETPGARF